MVKLSLNRNYISKMLKTAKTRIIAHVDLDYFFAQCEERENPSYKGKPVVVCVYSARGGDSGVVSTANYVARRFGVKSGMPIFSAKRLLKEVEAVFLPVNHELYNKISDEIMEILRDYSGKFEQRSIDEASLDITERTGRNYGRAEKLALDMKREILMSEGLTCSVGVAPNKLLAKMTAGFNKPDGLKVVRPEEVKSFLFPLPVGELYGVGRKTERVMLELGINTLEDLAKYRIEDLVKVFGEKMGMYFHNAANGVDESPVREREGFVQISKITTLKKDSSDLNEIISDLYELCKAVHERIVNDNIVFRSLGIMVVTENMSIHSRSITLDSYVSDLETLKRACYELLERFLKESPLKIRRIGVRVTNFNVASQKTLKDFQ